MLSRISIKADYVIICAFALAMIVGLFRLKLAPVLFLTYCAIVVSIIWLTFFKPSILLLAIIALHALQGYTYLGGPSLFNLRIEKIIGILTAVGVFLPLSTKRLKLPPRSVMDIPLLSLVLLGVLSVLFTYKSSTSIEILISEFSLLGFYGLQAILLSDRKWLAIATEVFLLSISIAAILALKMQGGTLDASSRILWRGAAYGGLVAVGTCFAFAKLIHIRGWERYLSLTYVLLFIPLLLLSASRAPVFGAALAVLYLAIGNKRRILLPILLLLLIVNQIYSSLPTWKSERLMMRQTQIREKGVKVRLADWYAGTLMFLDHPLGVGLGNYEKYLTPYSEPTRAAVNFSPPGSSHNEVLRIATELGIAGLFLFGVIVWSIILSIQYARSSIVDDRRLAFILDGCTASLLFLLVHALTHGEIHFNPLWIVLGLLSCIERIGKQTEYLHNHELPID